MSSAEGADGGVGGSDNSVWFLYTGQPNWEISADITHLRIDPSVKVIAQGAFSGCEQLKFVDIVKCETGLETIGQDAFYKCKSLRRFKVPSTVKKIGEGAFCKCEQLVDVQLCEGLQEIGKRAFYGCKSLKRFKVPSTVKHIRYEAFFECDQLVELEVCKGREHAGRYLTHVGAYAFGVGELDVDDNGELGIYCWQCGCDECYCTDSAESDEASGVAVDGIEEDTTLGGNEIRPPQPSKPEVVMGLTVLRTQGFNADNEEAQEIGVRERVIKNICSNEGNDAMDIEENNLKHCNCAICFDMLKNATSLNCGHTFCSTCVEAHRQRNPLCPNCRVVITGAYPNYIVRNILNSMKAGSGIKATTRPSSPKLMGMSDVLLEKILYYVSHSPSQLCLLETVCKRVCRVLRGDDFWDRHPFIYPRTCPRTYPWVNLFGDDERNRMRIFHMNGVLEIKRYQQNATEEENAIINTLGGADGFRDVVDNIISRTIHRGPTAELRLRGDTVSYLSQILQGSFVRVLENALLMTVESGRVEVQRQDISFVLATQQRHSLFADESLPRCNVAAKGHGVDPRYALGCSCNIRSSSGTVWRWPKDDCNDVLPEEAGRRIVRRLAYQAGILRMRSDAFALVETELLHTLGVLVVHAYEASYEATRTATHLSEDERLVYNAPTDTVDMFQFSPPPELIPGKDWDDADWDDEDDFVIPNKYIHTIVPGQIKDAARERNVTPFIVYASGWATCSNLTEEEEREVEESYYFRPLEADTSETESQGCEMNEDDSDSDDSSFDDHNLGPFCSGCHDMKEEELFEICASNAFYCNAKCQQKHQDFMLWIAEREAKKNGSGETKKANEDDKA